MSDFFGVRKTVVRKLGSPLEELVRTVSADGKITDEAVECITRAARSQSGDLRGSQIDAIERLGHQIGKLAASLGRTRDAESLPTERLASYPLTSRDLGKIAVKKDPDDYWNWEARNLNDAVYQVVARPGEFYVRGAKKNESGGYDVLVATPKWPNKPTNADQHYLVSIDANGTNATMTKVKVD